MRRMQPRCLQVGGIPSITVGSVTSSENAALRHACGAANRCVGTHACRIMLPLPPLPRTHARTHAHSHPPTTPSGQAGVYPCKTRGLPRMRWPCRCPEVMILSCPWRAHRQQGRSASPVGHPAPHVSRPGVPASPRHPVVQTHPHLTSCPTESNRACTTAPRRSCARAATHYGSRFPQPLLSFNTALTILITSRARPSHARPGQPLQLTMQRA